MTPPHTCNNAKRMWKIWMYLLNVAVIEPHDLINCGSELVQAVIFKQIIKIERIKDCRISSIVNHIKKILRIELLVTKDIATESMIFKLTNLHYIKRYCVQLYPACVRTEYFF